jgi:hypothetical protein
VQARFTAAVTTLRHAVEGKLARQRQAGVVRQQPGEGACYIQLVSPPYFIAL